MSDFATVKKLIDDQNSAFEEFKKTHTAEIIELKKNRQDPLTEEKLAKIDKSLNDLGEANQKLLGGIEAERKEREELEKRLNRPNATEKTPEDVKFNDFNRQLKAKRRDLGKPEIDLDRKGFEEYCKAFDNYIRYGKEQLTAEEVKTMQVSVDPDGGYLVSPDTSGQIVKKLYETSPMRQLATVITTSKDRVEGIDDLDEAGAGYAGERATSGNTKTPQVGKWEVPVWNIDTEPKITQNLLDDADIDVGAWLGGKVSDKLARFQNAEHITGAAKIRGIMSYPLVADTGAGVAWGAMGYLKTGVDGDFAATDPADKIFDLVGLVKNGYLNGASFLTKREVITKIRKFKDTNHQYLWQPALVAGQPETLMGYTLARAEDLAALSTHGNSMAFGNFKEAYLVVDRKGASTLRDPYTAKPFIKFYTVVRSGGGVVNFEAVKVLQFAA
jgi:HK97 family phage major capsid protein